ncbi:MAG: hypothetical protein ABIT83_01530 [Massilia sp.]
MRKQEIDDLPLRTTIAAKTANATLCTSSVAASKKYIESGSCDPLSTKLGNPNASSTTPLHRLTAAAANMTFRENKVPMSSARTDQRGKFHNQASCSKVEGAVFFERFS